MNYKRLRISLEEFPKRLYRVILVREDINLVDLGCAITTAIGAAFEHYFMFNKGKKSYVSDFFMEDAWFNHWLPMSKYTLSVLGDRFEFEYDTGEYWSFKVSVGKKDFEIDSKSSAIFLEGVGQGIWEDNKQSLMAYLGGKIDPNETDYQDLGYFLPWNFDNKKFSDFEDPKYVEQIKETFESSYEFNMKTFKANEAEYLAQNSEDFDLEDDAESFVM